MLKRITLIFTEIWEIVFPYRPDAKIVASIQPTDFLDQIKERKVGPYLTLLPFYDQRVRACIHELKYHRNQKSLDLLAAGLQKYLSLEDREILIIPIPLSKERLKHRGFNQTTLLVKAASKSLPNYTVAEEVLIKTKDTIAQTKLTRDQRLKNLKDAFAVNPQATSLISGKHVLIIDDVTTTGATLSAAKATLLPHHPASITALALAH